MSDDNAHSKPLESPPNHGLTPQDPYEKFIDWAAGLPWWAIILVAGLAFILYSMASSQAYRDVIRSLADDPQFKTNDKFEVVQIVGEPTVVTGRYVTETTNSSESVIESLLDTSIKSNQVTRKGFIQDETLTSITIQTTDGPIRIRKDRIIEEQRTKEAGTTQITLTYLDRITVTGVLTDQDDQMMKIRTVDEVSETFATARILSRETATIPCAEEAEPECQPHEVVTIQRQGEILTGKLNTLSNTSMRFKIVGETEPREVRRSEIDYLYIPTLTIAINERNKNRPVAPGDEVQIAFIENTDITVALAELKSLENVPVALRYTEGEARVVLVAYPDLESALIATGKGEVRGLIYLDDGPDRLAVEDWVEEHPNAGVILPTAPRECEKDCTITVKLVDDEITGRVAQETEEKITLVTTEAVFTILDKDKIIENRSTKPGVCALNNLRGCNAGLFLTLRVTFLAYALALVIGLIFGLMRVQTNPIFNTVAILYVEIIRGIPLLVILLYAGFVISPWLRKHTLLNLNDEQEAILGLSFGYGAFIAENFRAGIQSISRGQMEAARSLGMSYPQSMRYVVLPQAVRVILPPLGNDFISMLKDSALISVLALPDLLQLGRLHVSRTFRAFEGYNTVAVLYLIMTLFLSMLVRIIERRTRLPS